jgi:hypothetical protein
MPKKWMHIRSSSKLLGLGLLIGVAPVAATVSFVPIEALDAVARCALPSCCVQADLDVLIETARAGALAHGRYEGFGLTLLLGADLPPELQAKRDEAVAKLQAEAGGRGRGELVGRLITMYQISRLGDDALLGWQATLPEQEAELAKTWAAEACSVVPEPLVEKPLLRVALSNLARCEVQRQTRAEPTLHALESVFEMPGLSISGRLHALAIERSSAIPGPDGTRLLLRGLQNQLMSSATAARQVLRMRILSELAKRGLGAAELRAAGATDRELSCLMSCIPAIADQ